MNLRARSGGVYSHDVPALAPYACGRRRFKALRPAEPFVWGGDARPLWRRIDWSFVGFVLCFWGGLAVFALIGLAR